MPYRGFLIVCHTCLFPIRMPDLWVEKASSISILLACPACAHVEQYNASELKAVAFRFPDPIGQKRAELYVVEIPCAVSRCHGMARIYTVAATSISVSSLLEVWKYWVIHAHCHGHCFKARRRWTWGVYGVHQVH